MKAVQYFEYGGPDVLKIVDIDSPQPGPGEVRITVRAVGVNPIDWKRRAGYLHDFMPVTFPGWIGEEASGFIDEIGEGVTNANIGDAVFGYGRGTLAEQAVLRSWAVIPDGLGIETAGGLAVVSETATRILNNLDLKPGETLLVAGAAGGVGTAVIQLARSRGAFVIGTASEPKHKYLLNLGAAATTYGPGLVGRVHEMAPRGIDAAVDVAGAGIIPDLVEIVGNPSRIVSISDVTAPQYGVTFLAKSLDRPEEAFAEVARMYIEGRFALPIDRTFSMDQVALAQETSALGRVTGKLVIKVR
ncbi:NADP-dependent oxidoreductase [Sphingomonas sp. PP-CE-1G-424]|uniref:NADP-dependent oxidoreductase n=1 Tax=Sphingomonas sp. PP-CE-1G-424 TaxID=2135658 RepID=UPI001056CBBF|nr:NADP-dependent oxidoreductase [Sphingomonas sp. PP-CE-1G-424]TCP64298.1 NADPH:quinone reductase-like Zn-dependent oxidoreductase [Sphingomonas sp. PP-CE-1G-424]